MKDSNGRYMLETKQIWKFIDFGMKDSNGRQMLETKQIWKFKFANPKLGMETR